MKKILFSFLIFTVFTGTAQNIYVSPLGNDKNSGTIDKPIATLERAKELVKKTNKTNNTTTVYLRKGTYTLSHPFILNTNDGGTIAAPVVYTAYNNETVNIRGSKSIPLKYLKKVTDATALSRINQKLKDSIVYIDLTALKLEHIKTYADKFDDDGDIIELFMDGERMPLSRYPNEGNMTIKKVIINGGGQEVKNEDWRNFYANGAKEQRPPRPGVFEYRDERTGNWVKSLDRGVWLKGYWRIPWQNEAVRIDKIDTIAKTITLSKPVSGGIGNKYTRPEGNGKEAYWVMNLVEEIDQPGEWAIDFKDKILYFYPPKPIKENSVRIADISEPLIQLINVSNVQIKNIIIEENLNDGIKILGGENNLIAGCTIRNVTKNGITVDNGIGHTILSNDIYYTGAGGVWLRGGNESVTPKISSEYKVINNHIHHYSVLQKIYAAAINAGFSGGGGGGHHVCVGAYIAHNMIHDAPHVGVLFGSWNSVFEYNEIFNYCLVSDDMGAFYSYDLYERMGGHTFAYNFIHNSSIGDGIYFDHDHREMKIYGNLIALNSAPKRRGTAYLYKIGSQPKNPYTIECYNNMAINCNYGFEVVTTGSPATNSFNNNIAVECTKPYDFKFVTDKVRDTPSTVITSGINLTYNNDPGFVNMKAYDFRLKPESKIFKDLPNFKPLPIEKMGLFIDEYRKVLPSDKEVNRFINLKSKQGMGTDILDRE